MSKTRSDDVHRSRTLDIAPQSGGWLRLARGECVRIVDVEGQQVADMFAVSADDPTEWLSAACTRGVVARLFPVVGEAFHSNRYGPMLTLVEDHSPGVHDMLYRACDPPLYVLAGASADHPSCTRTSAALPRSSAGHRRKCRTRSTSFRTRR
jgi:uncharacterized protein YcgI (DUF1989 family)